MCRCATDVLHVREHGRLGRHEQQLGSSRTCEDDREWIANKSDARPFLTQRHHCSRSHRQRRCGGVQFQLTILLRDAASQPLGELLERGHDADAVAAAVRLRGEMKWRIRWKS